MLCPNRHPVSKGNNHIKEVKTAFHGGFKNLSRLTTHVACPNGSSDAALSPDYSSEVFLSSLPLLIEGLRRAHNIDKSLSLSLSSVASEISILFLGSDPPSASCRDFMILFPICTLNEKRSEMPQHGQLPLHACFTKALPGQPTDPRHFC